MKKLAKIKDTNEYFIYDQNESINKNGEKLVNAIFFNGENKGYINENLVEDISSIDCDDKNNDDIFNGHTPYFNLLENDDEIINDAFDYRGAYLQLKKVNENLRATISSLEQNISDGKKLIKEYALELDKRDYNEDEPNDIRLKLLREKNIKLEEENKNLYSQNKSIFKQIKNHENRIKSLEDIIFGNKNNDNVFCYDNLYDITISDSDNMLYFPYSYFPYFIDKK